MNLTFADGSVKKAEPEILRSHVIKLTSTTKPRNYQNLKALDEAAQYIFDSFKKAEVETSFQTFTASGKRYKNVIGFIKGRSDKRIVIGAHYDVAGGGPGADDNASGVSGLLELAAMLNRNNTTLNYSVELVAFCLEEPPFFASTEMGSAIHAQSLKKADVQVKVMLSLEMIGYFSEKENSQQYPATALKYIYPTKGNFISVVGRLDSILLTRKIKKLMKTNSDIDVQFINAPESLPGVDLSDHRCYWEAGYPAVMITDTAFFRNPNYHQDTDTADTLDYKKMAEVINGVYGVVNNL